MFQFRRFPTYAYLIQRRLTEYCSAGFPHSDIHGSPDICSSPWLFAACHVLLRLLMPRHSPCALSSLTNRKRSLVLIVELCRHFTDSRNCNCYPSPIRCSTIITFLSSRLLPEKPLCCLAFTFFFLCSVFKVQSLTLKARFQSLLPRLSNPSLKVGGDSRDRTGDLLLARQALSQLSYIPLFPLSRAWWARVGSNHRPYDYQSYALAS